MDEFFIDVQFNEPRGILFVVVATCYYIKVKKGGSLSFFRPFGGPRNFLGSLGGPRKFLWFYRGATKFF